jgi:hypothetical protein
VSGYRREGERGVIEIVYEGSDGVMIGKERVIGILKE